MKHLCTRLTAIALICLFHPATLSASIPLVFQQEHTGLHHPKPELPDILDLPIVESLPDPFLWSGSEWERSTRYEDWNQRRAEIGWEIQHYEIGPKPLVCRDSVSARYADSVLTVIVRHNGRQLQLTSRIVLPEGKGPFPAIIGMNRGSGSLPEALFTDRNIALITFAHNQVTTYYKHQNSDPFYQLYPELNVENSGQYAAWAWGVSRILDGLELCQATLPIDLAHVGVTGCSYAGKMALFAGAFDERIALTIAQESGGGGVAAWRVSETLGKVETLGATDRNWFADHMFAFSGSNTAKLPFDHHELCAMIAPRALFVLGNPDYTWLADTSGYVSIQAARKVYETFGIEDRCGFTIVGGHPHCQLPIDQAPEVEAFVDRFLLGDNRANTLRTKSQFEHIDLSRWITW